MRLERAQLGLLAALAATVSVSVFAAETAFVLGLLVFGVRLVTRETRIEPTPLDAPLLAYAVWTLLSASFAADPGVAHEDAKELLLFALFYLAVNTLTREDTRERVLSALLLGGLALATSMLADYYLLGRDTLDQRPSGFLGHWMSASGVVMGVLLVGASRLAFGRRGRPRPRDAWLAATLVVGAVAVTTLAATGAGVLPIRLFVAALAFGAMALALAHRAALRAAEGALPWAAVLVGSWALVISQTRNAWLGAVAGLATIAIMRAPRLLWALAAGVTVLVLLHPAAVGSRLTITDRSSVDRYYQWQAGVDMILDKPVFGQGPGMILLEYPHYRWRDAPNPDTPHLHNNALQIAATRGLPGLAFFTWWVVVAMATALAEARRARAESPAGWPAVAAFAGLVAILAAGVFEYNLGDSEVLMLALLLTSLPFARQRERLVRAS
jgi:O-antigen ligase